MSSIFKQYIEQGVQTVKPEGDVHTFRANLYRFARRHNLFAKSYINNDGALVFILLLEKVDGIQLPGQPPRGYHARG